MTRNLYLLLIGLVVLELAACQSPPATPMAQTPRPATGTIAEFFKGEAGRWLSIALPAGWVAKSAGTDSTPTIVVTDNWEEYQNKDLDKEAVGIIVLPLKDKGTPTQVMDVAVGRLKTLLADRQGDVISEQRGDQQYTWAEYAGAALEGEAPSHYFLAVIATDQRSVLVFTSTSLDQQESIRPKYQAIVKAITLY